tara:strand:+ start:1058 stop:1942 length:885 start_codon:yes stop_codon:yes gene_type:complete
MKKKILLTGSSGFIGNSLTINLLKQKHEIYVILKNDKKNKSLAKNIKKKFKNYKPIFINNTYEIEKKISNIKINTVVNLASKYLRSHDFKKMVDLINSNILFTTAVLEALPKKNLKKYINLSSVMIHKNSEEYYPQNLYAATKKGFQDILKYYELSYKKIKFYNLFLHDIYGENDKRNKIIHTIIKKHRTGKYVKIFSKHLYLNLLNVKDVINAINLMISKKIKTGQYIIKSKKFINLLELIHKTNQKLKKKIQYRVLNNKIENQIKKKIKILPNWRQKFFIEKDLIEYLDENN